MTTEGRHLLDVEFLLDHPSLNKPLVYVYRSGALRAAMKKRLREIGKMGGLKLLECDPTDSAGFRSALIGFTLFSGFWLFDCWHAASKVDSMLNALAALEPQNKGHCAVFIPERNSLRENPSWARVEATSLVIEEPLLTRQTLLPILRYLEATTDLIKRPGLLTQAGFLASFDGLLQDRRAGLYDVIHAFDYLVVTQSDRETNEFAVRQELIDGELRVRRKSSLHSLRQLLDFKSSAVLMPFLASLEEHHLSGLTARDLLAKLYRMTDALLQTGDTISGQERPTRGEFRRTGLGGREASVVLWAALMIVWDERVAECAGRDGLHHSRGPDMTMVRLEQMARDFLSRVNCKPDDDPLAELWVILYRRMVNQEVQDISRLAINRLEMIVSLSRQLEAQAKLGGACWSHKLWSCITASGCLTKQAQDGTEVDSM